MARGINPAEEVVEKVLNKLKSEGKILESLRNRQNDRLDVEGIDFLIFLNNGLALPLQVKTLSGDHRMNQKKLAEHFRKHKHVRFVLFVPVRFLNDSPERVHKIVERKLRTLLNLNP